MGLFNTGKNEKADKVEKYEEPNDPNTSKGNRRSSKHQSKKFGAVFRPMPPSSFVPFNGNYFTPNMGYPQSFFGISPII